MRTLNQRGQGMTEYIILVALIAIVAIAAVKYFGSQTKKGFETAAEAVGGVNETAGKSLNSGVGALNEGIDRVTKGP